MTASLVVVLLWLASAAAPAAEPVRLILDTDMSGDCDDAGALALLHALADRGECEILATVVNRKDLANASAAATSAINTWYGRPEIPIGTDKVGPTARPSIEGGQPSYDQAAALYAVRGSDPKLWREERGGQVVVDETGLTRWEPRVSGRHVLVHRSCDPKVLAREIENLMVAPPTGGTRLRK